MILWASVLVACLMTVAAAARAVQRSRPTRHDPDWGDWPPDHMAP